MVTEEEVTAVEVEDTAAEVEDSAAEEEDTAAAGTAIKQQPSGRREEDTFPSEYRETLR